LTADAVAGTAGEGGQLEDTGGEDDRSREEEHWSVRSKLLGTLVVPGGLALPLSLGTFAGSTESCSTPPTLVGGASPDSVCTGGPSGWLEVLGPVAFVLLLLAPIATVIYLGLQLRHRPRTAPAMP
jgi:hypothetical protein